MYFCGQKYINHISVYLYALFAFLECRINGSFCFSVSTPKRFIMHLDDFPTQFNGACRVLTRKQSQILITVSSCITSSYRDVLCANCLVLSYLFVKFHSIYNISIPAIQHVGIFTSCLFSYSLDNTGLLLTIAPIGNA